MRKLYIVLFLSACSPAFAGLDRYVDPDQFLDAAIDVVNVQSFENSPADSHSAQSASFLSEGLQITTPQPNLSIHNAIEYGQAPVTGSNYLRISGGDQPGGSTVTFQFDQPIVQFALHVIDWGDGTQTGSPTLTANTDRGQTLQIASGLQTNGNAIFFGFATDMPFTTLTIQNDIPTDSWAVDDIYFVTPEPATIAILAAGSLMLLSRKRQHKTMM